MIYLTEIECLDADNVKRTLRYSDAGLTTKPGDNPPNEAYLPRLADPGSIERHIFSSGRTFGDPAIGGGEIRLRNTDGELDYLRRYAFDGRTVAIWQLESRQSPFSQRQLIFEGTMAQAEFRDGDLIISIRDWLEALRQPLQTLLYKGTVEASGAAEAESTEDLADKRKTMLYGSKRGIPAALVDPFEHIYEVSASAISQIVSVRDRGVRLTNKGDFLTLAAMKAATCQAGEFVTCLAIGKFRLGGSPTGVVTVAATEGGSIAERTAGQIARRMLVKHGLVPDVDFSLADITALDLKAPYECGVWFGVDADISALTAVTFVLNSVGASLTPDYAGMLRIRRFELPVANDQYLDEAYFLEDEEELNQDASSDFPDGLPVKEVTLKYGSNETVFNQNDIDVNADDDWKTFAVEQWRQVIHTNAGVKERHPHANDFTIETALVNRADAIAEASRRGALYAIPRWTYRLPMKTKYALPFDLSTFGMLRASRYELEAGAPVVVLGVINRLEDEQTTLIVWR